MGATLMLGTTDNQPLEFKVNNQRGLRLEYATNALGETINVIGGYSGNLVSNGATGGRLQEVASSPSSIKLRAISARSAAA